MEQKVVALIPARGGSKRLPNKNLLDLHGHPLIAWTINQAIRNRQIVNTVISSDSDEIISTAKVYGASTPFKRPPSLATDDASTDSVILHAIEELELEDKDVIVLLQPTSPLRHCNDIQNAIELFFEKNADGVVSVCECEHSPLWTGRLPKDRCLAKFFHNKKQTKRSQDLPTFFRLNGSIFVFNVGSLRSEKGIHYGKKVFGYEMPIARSMDIDNELDLFFCEALLKNKKVALPEPLKSF